MNKLIEFLNELENRKIYYYLNKVRDSIMVEIAVPGQRWEVEFFSDGNIEVEKFKAMVHCLINRNWRICSKNSLIRNYNKANPKREVCHLILGECRRYL